MPPLQKAYPLFSSSRSNILLQRLVRHRTKVGRTIQKAKRKPTPAQPPLRSTLTATTTNQRDNFGQPSSSPPTHKKQPYPLHRPYASTLSVLSPLSSHFSFSKSLKPLETPVRSPAITPLCKTTRRPFSPISRSYKHRPAPCKPNPPASKPQPTPSQASLIARSSIAVHGSPMCPNQPLLC